MSRFEPRSSGLESDRAVSCPKEFLIQLTTAPFFISNFCPKYFWLNLSQINFAILAFGPTKFSLIIFLTKWHFSQQLMANQTQQTNPHFMWNESSQLSFPFHKNFFQISSKTKTIRFYLHKCSEWLAKIKNCLLWNFRWYQMAGHRPKDHFNLF